MCSVADRRRVSRALRRPVLGLWLTLAAAAVVMPAWGQTAPAAEAVAGNGAQNTASVPDFSGIWAHMTWPDFEPPPAGPGPVTNRSRRNGRSDAYELVGDYTNPILKPHAAEEVKWHGDISLTGVPYPTPSNQCWPDAGAVSSFQRSACRCCRSRTRSRSFTPTIMKSATCASISRIRRMSRRPGTAIRSAITRATRW